jgi:hypothetical protein
MASFSRGGMHINRKEMNALKGNAQNHAGRSYNGTSKKDLAHIQKAGTYGKFPVYLRLETRL